VNYHDLEVKVQSDDPPHSRVGSCAKHGTDNNAEAQLDLDAAEDALRGLAAEEGARTSEQVQREIGTQLYHGLFGGGRWPVC
jgi:hypothetical protein